MSTVGNSTSPAAAAAAAAAAIAEYDALLVSLRQLFIANCSQIAALTVLAWDTFVTFGDEVEHIWRTKWSIPKVLFLLARYYGLIHLIIIAGVSLTIPTSLPFCRSFFWYYSMGGAVLFTTLVNVILLMRIHALYGRSVRMLIFLIVLLVGELGIELYVSALSGIQDAKAAILAPPGIPLTGCLTTPPHTHYTIASWTSCLLVATIFFGLTMVKFVQFLKKTSGRFTLSKLVDSTFMSPLLQAFYGDGSLFFFLIFAVVLFSTVTILGLNGPFQTLGLPWITTVYSISASRLVLNLRAAARRQKVEASWADTLTLQPMQTASVHKSYGDRF